MGVPDPLPQQYFDAAHPETMRDWTWCTLGGSHHSRKTGPVIFVTWRPGSQGPGRFTSDSTFASRIERLIQHAGETADHHCSRSSPFQRLHAGQTGSPTRQNIVDK